MPQPKSSGGRSGSTRKASTTAKKPAARKPAAKKSTARKTATRKPAARRKPAAARRAAPPASGVDAVRDALSRVSAPLDLVVLTRDRVQEIADEAVERGRMTRGDAEDLVRDIVKRGRKQTEDLLSEIESLLGRATKAPPVDRVAREVDRARRVVGVGPSFPILRFDDLTAAQVSDRLTDLSAAELRKVRDYERRNANRKSVLAAIERKLG
jgi:polyhydroxyalkanoate synthesis regulator phasin